MCKRLARNPSTASLMPAARNKAKAMRISPSVIAQTTMGTSKIRPKVMRFGILKPPPACTVCCAAPFAAPSSFCQRMPACRIRCFRRLIDPHNIARPARLHTRRFRRRRPATACNAGLRRIGDFVKDARYTAAGVDIDAGNRMVDLIKPLVRATARPGAGAEIGGFGGLFDLKQAGFSDPILVATTDGVGTKVKIAIETGDHDTIGIDLVAMSVNDLVAQGAEPLFFLDYFACGQLDPKTGATVMAGIAKACRLAGCALIGGETAEMPGLYASQDYDLAGFAVGAVERARLLPRADIRPGDAVLGLVSSGVHSNGFSLVRRIVSLAGLAWDAPAPFDPQSRLGRALLEPTRIYATSCLAALRENPEGVKALAHITGGGLTENVPRVLPAALGVRVSLHRRRCCGRSIAVSEWWRSPTPVGLMR